MALLEVRDLSVAFRTKKGFAHAVNEVNFEVDRGETLAIVGESGSGKSVTAMAMMGLLPRSARITGSARFDGTELVGMSQDELRGLRGRRISMIFQDPMTAFNPVFTIGDQIAEVMLVHGTATKDEAYKRVVELLELVGVPEAPRRAKQYPHEYSGGMRQRAMIAMAIANKADLLIADEPTTALDVTIQAQVMDVLAEIQAETGAGVILITHDLGLVAGTADRVQVMYGGRRMESGETRTVFYNPSNPYTRGLLASLPRLDERQAEKLDPIPGSPPSIVRMPPGCAFAPRCAHRADVCVTGVPPLVEVGPAHVSRCFLAGQLPPVDRTSEVVS